jgi:hypothetical protein
VKKGPISMKKGRVMQKNFCWRHLASNVDTQMIDFEKVVDVTVSLQNH